MYKGLNDATTGQTLDIFPRLRAAATNVTADLTYPVGTFRLAQPVTEWGIISPTVFSIQFECVEVI